MSNKRVSKFITKKEDIDYLVNLTEEETLTTTFIMEMFGEFNGKQRFNSYDLVEIPANSYGPEGKKNKNKFVTTIGAFIFNKCFIEKDLFNLFQYIDEPLTSKKYEELNDKMSYAVLEDEITIPVLRRFIMKTQKYQPYVHILTPNHTMMMLLVTKKVNKRKSELLKKYHKELEMGNEKIADIMEKELLNYATELLQDDPSMDVYNSGAKGSIGNNFKNLFVMRGAIKDPDPTKGYNIVTSSYMSGIKKEEYVDIANSLAAGPFARAKKTEIGGYWEKLFLIAFQHVISDEPGSDCKTNRHILVDVTKNNIKELMYNFVIEGNKLVEITSKNMNRFIGTTIKMRFVSMCENKKPCNMCIGTLFYRLGIRNIGITTPQIPSKLKNRSMKSFHDSSVTFHQININECF